MLENTDKKAQIIEAADNLFHRYGYSKTSLDDIAGDAGLGKGTIYYYFESKEEIFMETVRQHSEVFYQTLKKRISEETSFENKFSMAIRLPIKLANEHAPILLDEIKNIPSNYLHKLDSFRENNKLRMSKILREILEQGYEQKILSTSVSVEKLVAIIYDWFLLGDSNIIIKNPDVFIKKAETDYEIIVQIMLNGILKGGNQI